MERMKKNLFSERGMKIINLLFFLSMLIRNRGIIFIAYTFWIIYLVYCIKDSQSAAAKVVYKIIIAFAAVMILLNVYFMVKYT